VRLRDNGLQLCRRGDFHFPPRAKRAALERRYNCCVMGKAACTFRQRDVTAAIKAAVAAGVAIARIEIDRGGKIAIIPGRPNDMAEALGGGNEWDSIS
jgi:hypothetical protein